MFGVKITKEPTMTYTAGYPTALKKAEIVHNFGLFECNRVKKQFDKNPYQSCVPCHEGAELLFDKAAVIVW